MIPVKIKEQTPVLLINPPYFFKKDEDLHKVNHGLWMPLGLLYLAAMLEKENIPVTVLDLMPREKTLEGTLTLIEKINPKLVGITCTTPQIRGMVQLGKAIKQNFGEKLVLSAGGPHISADSDFIKEFPFFDFIVVGEGEITFTELAKKIINKNEYVKDIYYGETCENLDAYPFPARHLLNPKDYSVGKYGSRFSTIHTTRGCPFNCIFCSNSVRSGTKIGYRTPKNVVDELKECCEKYNSKFFIFTDDTFTLRKERVIEMCKQILQRKLKIKWNCETRPNLIDEELLILMKKAGCVEIYLGVESGSERIRNEIIHKRIRDEDIYKAFSLCKKLGITTNAFLMAGFPTETKKELKETYDFCFKVQPDIIGLHLTSILPGSPIFNTAVKEGKIKPSYWYDYANWKTKNQPIYVPDGLTLEELEMFQKNLYRKFYFTPTYILRRLKISLTSFNLFKEDVRTAWTLFKRGKTTARSHREEDYY